MASSEDACWLLFGSILRMVGGAAARAADAFAWPLPLKTRALALICDALAAFGPMTRRWTGGGGPLCGTAAGARGTPDAAAAAAAAMLAPRPVGAARCA